MVDSRIPTAGPLGHILAVPQVQGVLPLDRTQDVLVVAAPLVRTQDRQDHTVVRVGLVDQMVVLLEHEDPEGRKAGQEGHAGRMAGRPAVLADHADRKVVAQGGRGDLVGQEDHASQAYFHPEAASRDVEAAFLPGDQVLDAADLAPGVLEDQDEGVGDQTPLTPCVAVARLQLE